MSHIKRIFIVGHPGAGKALFAKKLADKLKWHFVDADLGLENRIGWSLIEILSKEGQHNFLKCQYEILTSLLNQENIVVTTDASVILLEKNVELLSSQFTVNLKVSTSVQLERVSRGPEQLIPKTEIKNFFEKLHQERDGLYEDVASFSIDSDDSDLERHVQSTFDVIENNGAVQSGIQVSLQRKDMVLFHNSLHTPVYLTSQQAKCLKLLSQGSSSKEIARVLNISYRTVEGVLAKIMEAVGCKSSKELIVLYLDQH